MENNNKQSVNSSRVAAVPMACPVCGAKLESGKVKMHGGLFGSLFGGFQRPDCWFVSNNRVEETKVLRSYSSRPALACPDCGTTVILGKRSIL